MASMSADSQHKVSERVPKRGQMLIQAQLLSASLEEADPAVYEILQKVRSPSKRVAGKDRRRLCRYEM